MPAYGRIPSPPDERDFNLAHFMTDQSPLVQLMNAVLAAKGANASVKAWVKAATPLIIGDVPPPPTPPTPTSNSVFWSNPRLILDQGNKGTCVGHGWSQWGNIDPINDDYKEADALAIYYDATVFDGSPDDPNTPNGGQQGATVRSGAKAMLKRKRLSVYASAKTLDDALTWLKTKGPVVIGSDFMWDMEKPDSNGLVHPTGGVAGGHCYVADEWVDDQELIGFTNSWGTQWGKDGRFYMKKNEFQTLYDSNGEAWTAVELPLA